MGFSRPVGTNDEAHNEMDTTRQKQDRPVGYLQE